MQRWLIAFISYSVGDILKDVDLCHLNSLTWKWSFGPQKGIVMIYFPWTKFHKMLDAKISIWDLGIWQKYAGLIFLQMK